MDGFYEAWREREDDMADIVIFDGRRCPSHPSVVISSPDGMFDGLCDLCEGACYEAQLRDEAEAAEAERHARDGSPCFSGEACRAPHWTREPVARCDEEEIPF